MRSESCSFIWQPKVVTWKRFAIAPRLPPRRLLADGDVSRPPCRPPDGPGRCSSRRTRPARAVSRERHLRPVTVSLSPRTLAVVLDRDAVSHRRGVVVGERDLAGLGLEAVGLEDERAVLGRGHVQRAAGARPPAACRRPPRRPPFRSTAPPWRPRRFRGGRGLLLAACSALRLSCSSWALSDGEGGGARATSAAKRAVRPSRTGRRAGTTSLRSPMKRDAEGREPPGRRRGRRRGSRCSSAADPIRRARRHPRPQAARSRARTAS